MPYHLVNLDVHVPVTTSTTTTTPMTPPNTQTQERSAIDMSETEILIPNACPVCGSLTEPAANTHGWHCTDATCVWAASSDPA